MLTNAQATSGQLAAVKLSRQGSQYRRDHFPVKHLFQGRKDRRLPQKPAPTPAPQPAASADGVALGLLVLALQDCMLRPYHERRAWGLVAKWLDELVEVKHGQRGAA